MPYKDPATQREFQRRWMAERRADALADKTCAFCGADDRLEFHHFDPYDKVDHKVWSWAKARREAELAKCLILCRGCHIGHHQAQRPRFCKRGHEFTEANSYVKPGTGRRECRTCKQERARAYVQKKQAA